MSISYPLTLPAAFSFASYEIAPENADSETFSNFNLRRTTYEHTGERWRMSATFPIRTNDQGEARELQAWLTSLNGRVGTFYFGDINAVFPRGQASGTPLVDGGGQSGKTLNTKGWTAGVTGILKAGDWIQVGTGLHMVMKDANSGSPTGLSTLDIWPRIRQLTINNDPIITESCVGVFRLTSEVSWNSSVPGAYSFATITAVEDVPAE